jgi:hypothetical protein
LPVAGKVRLAVYDVLGQRVATLVERTEQPGEYVVSLSGSALPSGVYFYQLSTSSFTQVKKMLLIR